MFYKYFQTSDFRGSGPGDTTGCLAPQRRRRGRRQQRRRRSDRLRAAIAAAARPTPNFAFGNSFARPSLSRGKWSLMMTLLIATPSTTRSRPTCSTADNGALTGRSDTTWGIIALSATSSARTSVAQRGISSLQPALDSRYRYPRFPFFDFSGAQRQQLHPGVLQRRVELSRRMPMSAVNRTPSVPRRSIRRAAARRRLLLVGLRRPGRHQPHAARRARQVDLLQRRRHAAEVLLPADDHRRPADQRLHLRGDDGRHGEGALRDHGERT